MKHECNHTCMGYFVLAESFIILIVKYLISVTHPPSTLRKLLCTNTSCEFRVRSMNAKGTPGPYDDNNNNEIIKGSIKAGKNLILVQCPEVPHIVD